MTDMDALSPLSFTCASLHFSFWLVVYGLGRSVDVAAQQEAHTKLSRADSGWSEWRQEHLTAGQSPASPRDCPEEMDTSRTCW